MSKTVIGLTGFISVVEHGGAQLLIKPSAISWIDSTHRMIQVSPSGCWSFDEEQFNKLIDGIVEVGAA